MIRERTVSLLLEPEEQPPVIRDEVINGELLIALFADLKLLHPEGVSRSASGPFTGHPQWADLKDAVQYDGQLYHYESETVTVNGIPIAKKTIYLPVSPVGLQERVISTVAAYGMVHKKPMTLMTDTVRESAGIVDRTTMIHGTFSRNFRGTLAIDPRLKRDIAGIFGLAKPKSKK